MNKITVNGVEYVEANKEGERMSIVCVDNRGLTFVGKVNLYTDDDFIMIKDARCIIYWGTTGHIAELCAGPTNKTRLGVAHDVVVQKRNIVFAYECDGESWGQ